MRHNILFFLILLTTFVSVWGAIAQFPFPHHIWNGTSITYVPGHPIFRELRCNAAYNAFCIKGKVFTLSW